VTPLLAAIPSPSTNVVHLGPLTIHVYGLCYAVGIIAAVAITRRRWTATVGARELVYDVALWGVLAGVIGGHLYYLATTPGNSFDDWWRPFAVWHGGLGIWGGIALGTIVGIWRIRRAGAEVAPFLDAAAPALLAPRRSDVWATTSTKSGSAARATCRRRSRSIPSTDGRTTSARRPFIRPSCMSSPGGLGAPTPGRLDA
jgi:hypothetical protein